MKALQATIMELKCSLSAKTAEYNAVDASLQKARQETADKEKLFVLLTPLSYSTIDL